MSCEIECDIRAEKVGNAIRLSVVPRSGEPSNIVFVDVPPKIAVTIAHMLKAGQDSAAAFAGGYVGVRRRHGSPQIAVVIACHLGNREVLYENPEKLNSLAVRIKNLIE